jgi:hypothetical protein
MVCVCANSWYVFSARMLLCFKPGILERRFESRIRFRSIVARHCIHKILHQILRRAIRLNLICCSYVFTMVWRNIARPQEHEEVRTISIPIPPYLRPQPPHHTHLCTGSSHVLEQRRCGWELTNLAESVIMILTGTMARSGRVRTYPGCHENCGKATHRCCPPECLLQD